MASNLILITGAKGRIGRALLRHWRNRECVALDREDGDLTSFEPLWSDRFAGVETVIHLAADPDQPRRSRARLPANIRATLNVIRASSKLGVHRLIYASSVWAEYAAWQLSPRMRWYAASKIAGEALVQAWADQHQRPAVCLRFGYFDPEVTSVPPQAETHRLDQSALGFHLDEALAWSEPCCSVRYAMGKL